MPNKDSPGVISWVGLRHQFLKESYLDGGSRESS